MNRMPIIAAVLSIATVASITVSAPAQGASPLPQYVNRTIITSEDIEQASRPPTRTEVESALKKAGLPVGTVDGDYDDETRRGVCLWRELTGSTAKFSLPRADEADIIVSAALPLFPADNMIPGLNVSITCQGATWVTGTKKTGDLAIRDIFPVSTGGPSTPTRTGIHTLYRETDAWHESTEYAGAWMYRPKYFSRGQALHGSRNDAWLTTTPDTYGCVRLLQKDMDLLWKSKFNVGEKINIYGEWAAWAR